MSTALAIGAVTAVMRRLLEEEMGRISDSLGKTPDVTVLPPTSSSSPDPTPETDRLNLFLYQATPNTGWRNVGLPSRNSRGDLIDNPPLALDLHYLLTAYSKEPLHAEILLGAAMQRLHEASVLPRETIRSLLGTLPQRPLATFSEKAVVTAGLAEQVEQIKISLQVMGTEEISKLWTALSAQYRPTAVYQVSVVLIERPISTHTALPVIEPRIHVLPWQSPVLTDVSPQLVTPGGQLTLSGQNLAGEQVSIDFGSVAVAPDRLSDREIVVTVPSGLRAGVNTVQVIHALDFGPPSGRHRGKESNVMPFVLRPTIHHPIPDAVSQGGTVGVTLQVDPVIGKSQRVVLLLNELDAKGITAAYSAVADQRAVDSSPLTIPVPGVKTGDYLVRLQVDGAESLLEKIGDAPYRNPKITIGCGTNCLRSAAIALTPTLADTVLTVEGRVTVQDANQQALKGVRVAIRWTLPDGTVRSDGGTTGDGANPGIATFAIAGSPGTYTLTVIDLALAGYCFDPVHSSALEQSITG
jgi:hypothetical protein